MNADNWKWWHFVVAGLLIAAFGAYEFQAGKVGASIKSEILAALCLCVGVFSRPRAGGVSEETDTGQ